MLLSIKLDQFFYFIQDTALTLMSGFLPFSLVIVTVFILDYYIESVALNKLEPPQVCLLLEAHSCHDTVHYIFNQ